MNRYGQRQNEAVNGVLGNGGAFICVGGEGGSMVQNRGGDILHVSKAELVCKPRYLNLIPTAVT